MKSKKKEIRKAFRDSCFERDNYCCVKCGFKSSKETAEIDLDCHHIESRKSPKLFNGGYCKENGISLCSECHIKAEEYFRTGIAIEGYSQDDLFKAIDSSIEQAIESSKNI